jgi:hypothetical protein
LVSSTKFAYAVTSKILKIYSPTPFARRVGCEVMLSGGSPPADCRDVLADVSGQIIDMMGIERIIVDHGAAFGGGRVRSRKQNGGGQQEDADHHLTLLTKHNLPEYSSFRRISTIHNLRPE